jgi:hypothetical protein
VECGVNGALISTGKVIKDQKKDFLQKPILNEYSATPNATVIPSSLPPPPYFSNMYNYPNNPNLDQKFPW